MLSPWYRYGITMVSLWDRYEIAMRSLWDRYGITMGHGITIRSPVIITVYIHYIVHISYLISHLILIIFKIKHHLTTSLLNCMSNSFPTTHLFANTPNIQNKSKISIQSHYCIFSIASNI